MTANILPTITNNASSKAVPAFETTKRNKNSMKSVENTVFVRFVPPSNLIRRHHVEDLFSNCGPIKKSSIIHTNSSSPPTNASSHTTTSTNATETTVITTSSYGFVKYTTPEDAELAALQLHNRTMKIDNKVTVTVKVELAKQVKSSARSTPTAVGIDDDDPVMEQQRTHHRDRNVKEQVVVDEKAQEHSVENEEEEHFSLKKTNRLILRNLSFYAKESDIRKALQPYGTLIEVHIPTIETPNKSDRNAVKATHRGFAFVTFSNEKEAEQCLLPTNDVIIKERSVQISRSLHKTAYTQLQHSTVATKPNKGTNPKTTLHTKKNSDRTSESKSNNESEGNDNEDDGSHTERDNLDVEEKIESDDDGDDDDSSQVSSSLKVRKQSREATGYEDKTAVAEGRCLFVRNLPFDCTRHDVFDVFRTFGHVTSIFIVKDKETNKIPKGTAFVSFQKVDHANKALEAARATSNFVSQRAATATVAGTDTILNANQDAMNEGGIVIKGRSLLVDVAVDKETASTLTGPENNRSDAGHKDRRNLYLKGEGRVENQEKEGIFDWDELPENDKVKRQSAWSDKNTKLRSPIFFINPFRLSIRNLAKHVDEVALKKLIVTATVGGLKNSLVTPDDQIAHWRASGDYTTREILSKIQDCSTAATIIPNLDEKNIKQSIPALHIHRDFAPGGNKQIAPSRGFGFVEFEHHVHAIACLRELNNNPSYSAEYATGGKHVAEMRKQRTTGKKRKIETASGEAKAANVDGHVDPDGKIRIPRLIVEFTVENKAKAKQQAEHKAKQQANMLKQRIELKHDVDDPNATKIKSKTKKSRGALQREKKRKQQGRQVDEDDDHEHVTINVPPMNSTDDFDPLSTAQKVKGVKPPKKQAKIDVDEVNFSHLVESYQQQAMENISAASTTTNAKAKSGRRWFE
jgi:nucleolar protein 4